MERNFLNALIFAIALIIYLFLIIYLTLRARNRRLRKKPVAAENRIAPWSPSSIVSKIPASKTWQGSLCTTAILEPHCSLVPIQYCQQNPREQNVARVPVYHCDSQDSKNTKIP